MVSKSGSALDIESIAHNCRLDGEVLEAMSGDVLRCALRYFAFQFGLNLLLAVFGIPSSHSFFQISRLACSTSRKVDKII